VETREKLTEMTKCDEGMKKTKRRKETNMPAETGKNIERDAEDKT
jgi:hypothetical protein